MIAKFLKDTSGATAIEYGLIAGFVFLAIIAAVSLVGDEVRSDFALTAHATSDAMGK